MPMQATIRDAAADDATVLAAIYNHYIDHTVVTFETEPVSAADMAARVIGIQAQGLFWRVLEEGGQVQGYAYAGRWRPRAAYRHSVEASVYLAPQASGRGLGTRLYADLLARLQAAGLHAVIGGVALPNAASVALHEALGFVQVAHFRETGFKFGHWIDVAYWQKLLDVPA